MIAEAGAAWGAIKAAYDIAKGVSSLNSETEKNDAIVEVQRAILEAQSAALADKQLIGDLADELRTLKSQLATADAWSVEKTRYILTASQLGAYTYDLRPSHADGEAFHRLCCTCFNNGKKAILQGKAKHSGGELVECLCCKTELQLASFESVIRTVRNDGRYDELNPDY